MAPASFAGPARLVFRHPDGGGPASSCAARPNAASRARFGALSGVAQFSAVSDFLSPFRPASERLSPGLYAYLPLIT